MASTSLPFASLENEFVRLDYLTSTGPRIIGLYAKGVEGNLFAETPDAHWPTPHGEFYLRGGHRLWTAPEDPFYTCPDEEVTLSAKNDAVIVAGGIEKSGLQKEIAIRLDENRIHLTHRVTWHGKKSIELAPWGITQLRLGGMAILPLSAKDGLQPNRNLVLWPYTQFSDERLEIHDDVIILHGIAGERACKIGNKNSHGWIACALGDVLFTKRFTIHHDGKYPDLDCNVETYTKDVCIELETLGPLGILEQGESVTYDETWQVIVGNYPPTLETAWLVSKELSK